MGRARCPRDGRRQALGDSIRILVRGMAVAAALVGATLAAAGGAGAAVAPAPSVSAESAVLYVPATGQVLLAKNDQLRLMPASTTKVMTALVVTQHIHNLNRMVRITPGDAYVQGSSAPMRPGEELSVRDLLYGLLLVSGNNAAVALARATAGSVPAFVAMMNREAQAVGATHTHFADPNGLPEPTHLTTALDLARIAGAAMREPEIVRILHTKVLERYPMPSGPPQPMVNQDRLLWTYPGIVGGKIGFTDQAGNTMVAVARRHGLTLIAVVLHDVPWTLFSDEANLLTYGFDHYEAATLVPAGLALARRPVAGVAGRTAVLEAAAPVTWVAPLGASVSVRTRLLAPRRVPAGRPRGAVVGSVAVYASGKFAGAVPVALARATPAVPLPRPSPWPGLAWRLGLALAALVLARRAATGLRARTGRRGKPRRRRYRVRRDSVWMRVAGGDR